MSKTSEYLTEHIKFLDQAKEDYNYYYEQVHEKNNAEQDYLHELELTEMTKEELLEHAKKMRENRLERRQAKDAVEVLTPIVEFLESDMGKKSLNQLKQVLGKTRNIETLQPKRTYTKRVK